MSDTPSSRLSPAQREIMEIIWDRGEISAFELRELLSVDRDIARETVRTFLGRMEGKGWLKHRVIGRTYFYSACVPRDRSLGQQLVEVMDTMCGGSAEKLVSALIDYRGLTDDEAERIQVMIDAVSKKKPVSQSRKKRS